MKILVEHQVPSDEMYCSEFEKGGWRVVCSYIRYRNRHGKKGIPIQRDLPKCTLFNEWLEKDMHKELKCKQCKQSCERGLDR